MPQESIFVKISYSVIFFYLIIFTNFTTALLSKDFKNNIVNNRIYLHILALAVIIMTVNQEYMLLNPRSSILHNILIGIICYLSFLFSTKIPAVANIILIFIMLVFFFTEQYVSANKTKTKMWIIKHKARIRVGFIYVIYVIIIIGNLYNMPIYYKKNKSLSVPTMIIDYIFGKN
jgi:hypothetical protein